MLCFALIRFLVLKHNERWRKKDDERLIHTKRERRNGGSRWLPAPWNQHHCITHYLCKVRSISKQLNSFPLVQCNVSVQWINIDLFPPQHIKSVLFARIKKKIHMIIFHASEFCGVYKFYAKIRISRNRSIKSMFWKKTLFSSQTIFKVPCFICINACSVTFSHCNTTTSSHMSQFSFCRCIHKLMQCHFLITLWAD